MAREFLNALAAGQEIGSRMEAQGRNRQFRNALAQGNQQQAFALNPEMASRVTNAQTAQRQQDFQEQQAAREQQMAQQQGQAMELFTVARTLQTLPDPLAQRYYQSIKPGLVQSGAIEGNEERSIEEIKEMARLIEAQVAPKALGGMSVDIQKEYFGMDEDKGGPVITLQGPDGERISRRRDDPEVDRLMVEEGFQEIPSSQTSVTVNTGERESAREKELGKTVGQVQGEEFRTIIESGQQAKEQKRQLAQLESLLPQLEGSGPGKRTITNLKAFASGTLGLDPEAIGITDDTAPAEAFNAISNQLALRLRNPKSGLGLTGNTSDRDVQFLRGSIPGLGQTKEGNQLLLDMWGRVLDRRQEEARITRQFQRSYGVDGEDPQGRTLDEVLESYNEENPMFPEEFQQQVQQVKQPMQPQGLNTDITPPDERETEALKNRWLNGQ